MTARDFLEEALKLPAKERGRIVHELIRSLDAHDAEEPAVVQDSWADEVEARLLRAQRGETVGQDVDAACDEILSKLRTKK